MPTLPTEEFFFAIFIALCVGMLLGVVICQALLLAEKKRIRTIESRIEKLKAEKAVLESKLPGLIKMAEDSKKLRCEKAGTIQIPENVVQLINGFANLIVAIEHPEVVSNVEKIDAMVLNSKSAIADDLFAARQACHDIRDSQFIFASLNALIHVVNQPSHVELFKEKISQSAQTYDVVSRLSGDEKEKLRSVLIALKTEKLLQDYWPIVEVFEEVLLSGEK